MDGGCESSGARTASRSDVGGSGDRSSKQALLRPLRRRAQPPVLHTLLGRQRLLPDSARHRGDVATGPAPVARLARRRGRDRIQRQADSAEARGGSDRRGCCAPGRRAAGRASDRRRWTEPRSARGTGARTPAQVDAVCGIQKSVGAGCLVRMHGRFRSSVAK